MKLAVSSYSLSRWMAEKHKTLEDVVAWIADHKAEGIEFSGLDEAARKDPIGRARQLRDFCAQRGLAICGYCVGAELLVPPAQQQQVVKDIKGHIDVAAALGVKSMRHDVTRGPDAKASPAPTFEQVLAQIVPAIREAADYAQSKGVKTSLENHGFYMQASERVEKLLKAVDHSNFGLTLDMGNFLCVNEDPVAAVRRLARYAIHAHVKDFHVRPKDRMPPSGWFATPTDIALRGAIVGHGVIDVPTQLKLLKQAGYDGYLSLEFEGMEDPPFGVEQGLAYLRQQLKLA